MVVQCDSGEWHANGHGLQHVRVGGNGANAQEVVQIHVRSDNYIWYDPSDPSDQLCIWQLDLGPRLCAEDNIDVFPF